MHNNLRKISIVTFSTLTLLSLYFVFQLKFTFSLDQFFPEGDEDLAFFREFIKDFESDVNFLLVAVERKDGVFEQSFLEKIHEFTIKSKGLPHVVESQSLTKISYPIKTPFAITTIPAIHINQPSYYEKDKERLLKDQRFVNSLISEDATALVVAIKTVDSLNFKTSAALTTAVEALVKTYEFEAYHLLGAPYFQKEMVNMQKREITVSTIFSAILVCFVMFWIFRKPRGIATALLSILMAMILFLGFLGLFGRELNAMSALYPVLMIIVGTSDVIHIMSKYIDELRKGKGRKESIMITIKEIGLATLLTSLTTAIGFITLVSSKIQPIKDFGINAALGVLIAYITVIGFTTAVLSFFKTDQIIKLGRGQAFWEKLMTRIYHFTKSHPKKITAYALLSITLCGIGISKVTTNYSVEKNLPRGEKITEDFKFFEQSFAGFRPLEYAIFAQGDYMADDYEVLQQIEKFEVYLKSNPAIKTVNSVTDLYKSVNQMYHQNRPEFYMMPESKEKYNKYKKLIDRMPKVSTNVLLSKDRKKARLSSRILDLGTYSINKTGKDAKHWISENMDSTIVKFVQTGTGTILDKNSAYVRDSLLWGLGFAIIIVSLLMALLFRDLKMLLISLVPNIFPLLLAGSLLGYLGIELEAGISIVFAIIFGIAVDDTIHFLSKYKLARNKGLDKEAALHITFLETGKAICLTTIILFFGFLIMLFSIHPPSVTVGLLISITLLSAVIADLFFIPVMIRWMLKD